MKFKNIVKKSKKILKYVKKNNELPSSMDKGSVLYLLSRSVVDVGKNKKVIKVKTSNPKNVKTDIVLNRDEYLDLAKRVANFIDKKGLCPNMINAKNNSEVSVDLAIYCLAKVIFSYSKNKKLPAHIPFNSKIFAKPVKKHGHSNKRGCDNRGQNNGYYCGPHMVQEIIRNLTGKVIPQSTLAGIIGTTSSGSSHSGIDTCFAWFNKTYNQNLKVEWKNFSDVGWAGIKNILESNNKDSGIHEMYRRTSTFQGFGHYTNFDKIYDNSVDVHNSLGSSCNYGCYCGYTENRSKSEAKYYIDGISQKSVLVVTNEK